MSATRELLWLACREKTCCSHYAVMPTTADLWRISRALELPVWAFTRYAEAAPGEPGAFALDDEGLRFQVVLAKRREEAPAPCVFLRRLGDGHAQCALGATRPTVCMTYPAVLDGGVVCVGEHDGCTCGAWSEAALDEEDRAGLVRLERERAEHAELVAEWNAHVARDPRDRAYPEFCEHVLNAYANRHPDEWAAA
jgi:Fe-S-cluster containining protein